MAELMAFTWYCYRCAHDVWRPSMTPTEHMMYDKALAKAVKSR